MEAMKPPIPWPGLLLLLAGYVGLSILYQRATPPFEASDEGAHCGMVVYLHEQGRLPLLNRGEVIPLLNQEMTQAPLYYALSAWYIRRADLSDAEERLIPRPDSPAGRADRPGFKNIWQPQPGAKEGSGGMLQAVSELRVLSMLMGLGTVLLTWLMARHCWPEDGWAAFFAGSWIAFNPMFLFIANSVNNDNLVTLLATLSLYTLSRWPASQPSLRWPVGLGFVVGLAILAKVSGLILVPVVVVALLTRSSSTWRQRMVSAGALGAVVALVCGWWFLRNHHFYGEWTASQLQTRMLGNGRAVADPWALLREWDGFIKSYWGVFGAFNVIYPDWVYRVFFGVSAAAVVMTGWQLVTRRLRAGWLPLVLLFFSVLNLAGVAYWTSTLWGSQGRLLFPSIGAHALWWVMGCSLSPRLGRLFMASFSLGLFALAAWAALYVIPASYPT